VCTSFLTLLSKKFARIFFKNENSVENSLSYTLSTRVINYSDSPALVDTRLSLALSSCVFVLTVCPSVMTHKKIAVNCSSRPLPKGEDTLRGGAAIHPPSAVEGRWCHLTPSGNVSEMAGHLWPLFDC